jgi:hypothetical protein
MKDQTVTEPENLVLQILREMRGEMGEMRAKMATKTDISELRSEMNSRFADVASDFIEAEKRLRQVEKRVVEQTAGLRRSVIEYHSVTVSHGILYGELEERIRRLEARLDVAPEERRDRHDHARPRQAIEDSRGASSRPRACRKRDRTAR